MLPRQDPKLEQHVVDFDRLDSHADTFGAEDVFCCLGTTIKQAGSQEAFRRVDFGYVTEAARIASAKGAEQFGLVSALGADAGSRVFYNRVKGEAEDAVRALPFQSVHILRPSLLLGERKEFRVGERIAEAAMRPLGPLMRGPLRRFRPVRAHAVAAALVQLSVEQKPGVRVVESEEIRDLTGV
jgi:uncharacterized protein YbjT (DUF2867 family)